MPKISKNKVVPEPAAEHEEKQRFPDFDLCNKEQRMQFVAGVMRQMPNIRADALLHYAASCKRQAASLSIAEGGWSEKIALQSLQASLAIMALSQSLPEATCILEPFVPGCAAAKREDVAKGQAGWAVIYAAGGLVSSVKEYQSIKDQRRQSGERRRSKASIVVSQRTATLCDELIRTAFNADHKSAGWLLTEIARATAALMQQLSQEQQLEDSKLTAEARDETARCSLNAGAFFGAGECCIFSPCLEIINHALGVIPVTIYGGIILAKKCVGEDAQHINSWKKHAAQYLRYGAMAFCVEPHNDAQTCKQPGNSFIELSCFGTYGYRPLEEVPHIDLISGTLHSNETAMWGGHVLNEGDIVGGLRSPPARQMMTDSRRRK